MNFIITLKNGLASAVPLAEVQLKQMLGLDVLLVNNGQSPLQYSCRLTWDCALTFAPFVTKTLTTSACPAKDAMCKAVFPFCERRGMVHELKRHIYACHLWDAQITGLTNSPWERSLCSYWGLTLYKTRQATPKVPSPWYWPLWLHRRWLPSVAAQRPLPHGLLWKQDGVRSTHSEGKWRERNWEWVLNGPQPATCSSGNSPQLSPMGENVERD